MGFSLPEIGVILVKSAITPRLWIVVTRDRKKRDTTLISRTTLEIFPLIEQRNYRK